MTLHLSDGTLRRLLDETPTLPSASAHLERCARCRARLARIGDVADAVGPALAVSGSATLPEGVAAAQVRARLLTSPAARPAHRTLRGGAFAWAAAAVILVGGFALAPVRTAATNFLTIFEPRQFVAIPITLTDAAQLRALPDLGAYGTFRGDKHIAHAEVGSAAAAARLAHVPVLVPAYLPAGLDPRAHFSVLGPATNSFTFSATRARDTLAAAHARLSPMPSNLDGSTLQATIGPVVVGIYSPHRSARYSKHVRGDDFTGLAVVQAPAPRVWSTGASVAEIETYLLAQPGVPPQLAAQIRAIGDPTATLPIPIPIEREYAQPVVVQGERGLGIGDNTGL
ncbi:MAG: hypothetical protein ABI346_05265, partial [Candidatus Baltobacteraceae bacterium]